MVVFSRDGIWLPQLDYTRHWLKIFSPASRLKTTLTHLALVKRVSTGSSEELVEQGAALRSAAWLLLVAVTTPGNGRGLATPGNSRGVATPLAPKQAGL